jgi:hypothetical protein
MTIKQKTKMEKFNELKDLLAAIEADVEKFYEKGTKAAGVRARKGLQEIKRVAQELRVDISAKKNEE